MNEQENQKFTVLLSDTLPLFQPKHVAEARTEQSSKSENKPQGALIEAIIKYSTFGSLLAKVLSSLISHYEQQ